ncbi:DNA-binding transcriptional MerR regulator [Streptomyces turgidiscabies]|uniref:DNA-binding transcriptional MerR regulator n=1 Tax=Streptomyces turgidiscabies TaxID=85558 RepID=A0ABU0RNS1_9ACTN|nr:DNA-binding transcriptional MerR regulator [Streptomyces turgidiscabies]
MAIRRMKPLGFTLDQMRDLLDAADRLDGAAPSTPPSGTLLGRVRIYEQAATEQVAKLRVQLTDAEAFATTLRTHLNQNTAAARPDPHVRPCPSAHVRRPMLAPDSALIRLRGPPRRVS